jgi:poly-gamma-glutamate capsule biosynthesis protein CapA/YwtB (metallophosphatase superfamily)
MAGAMVTLALMGDTMLGRMVGLALERSSPSSIVAPEVVELVRDADLRVLNLECCISVRGERWAAPGKPFFFRAPPNAVDVLTELGVDCVTLANNHALDYGVTALLDTMAHLDAAGIARVGAGVDPERARAPAVLEARGCRLTVFGVTDHPSDFGVTAERPGVAWAPLREGVPAWLLEGVGGAAGTAVLVTPHWGPNMAVEPRAYVRRAAWALRCAGATLVAGHSAHVFQGADDAVLYDLGDFVDDYARDAVLRNDLGLLFLVQLGADGVQRIEAVPLKLEYCHTRLADAEDAAWIGRRFRAACRALGTEVAVSGGRLVVSVS